MENDNMFVVPGESDYEYSSSDSELEMLITDEYGERTIPSSDSSDISETISSTDVHFLEEIDMDKCFELIYNKANIHKEGKRLYIIFLRDELFKTRVKLPVDLELQTMFIDDCLCKYRVSLLKFKERFEQGPQKQWVQDFVQKIDVVNLSYRAFTQKVISLFEDVRISWEKILVVFYFCSEISLIALQQYRNERLFIKIQAWTLYFIDGFICEWVHDAGGWDVILDRSLTPAMKIAIISFCCASLIALYVYMKNNSK